MEGLEPLVDYRGNRRISVFQEQKIRAQVGECEKLYEEGKYDDSLRLIEEPYRILKEMAPGDTYTLYVGNYIGMLSFELKKYEDALKYFTAVYEIQEKIGADTSDVLNKKARVLKDMNKCEEAYDAWRRIYTARKIKFGCNHELTLKVQQNMAYTLNALNKYNEALQMYKDIYDIKVKKMGVNEPSTLSTQHEMAEVLKEQGNLRGALTNFQDVFEKRKITLGLHHPDTLDTGEELANVFATLKTYDKALEIYEYLHKEYAAAFGVDNEKALLMLEKTADMFMEQGEYYEAYCRYNKICDPTKKENIDPNMFDIPYKISLSFQEQGKEIAGLEMDEETYKNNVEILGITNSETLNSDDKHTLNASVCKAYELARQHKYDEALKIYEEILPKSKIVWGRESKNTLIIRANMANILEIEGNYQGAYEIVIKDLEMYEKNNDPSRLRTRRRIAEILKKQEKYGESLQMYKNLLSEQAHSLGPDHLDTLSTCNDVGSVLTSLGKLDEALKVLEKTRDKTKNILGSEHKQTLLTELNIATVVRRLGKYEEALNIYKMINSVSKETSLIVEVQKNVAVMLQEQGKYEEVLNILTDVLQMQKGNFIGTLDTLANIANISIHLGKYNTGEEILNKIYPKCKNAFGSENRRTVNIQKGMAEVLLKMDKHEEALQLFAKAYNVSKRPDVYGPDHPITLNNYNIIALVLCHQGKYIESLGMLKKVHEKCKKFSLNHPSVLTIEINISVLLSKLGKYDEALNMFNNTYKKMIDVLGATHPTTLGIKERKKLMQYLNSK